MDEPHKRQLIFTIERAEKINIAANIEWEKMKKQIYDLEKKTARVFGANHKDCCVAIVKIGELQLIQTMAGPRQRSPQRTLSISFAYY